MKGQKRKEFGVWLFGFGMTIVYPLLFVFDLLLTCSHLASSCTESIRIRRMSIPKPHRFTIIFYPPFVRVLQLAADDPADTTLRNNIFVSWAAPRSI